MSTKYTLHYMSDGEVLKDKSIVMVDTNGSLPRGNYFFDNVKVDGNQVDNAYIETEKQVLVAPGSRKTATPQVRIKKVFMPRQISEYFEPKEEFAPDFGQRLPYESMFRMFAKMYGLKTQDELDNTREAEIDLSAIDDDEDRYVLSQFGLLDEDNEETPQEVVLEPPVDQTVETPPETPPEPV